MNNCKCYDEVKQQLADSGMKISDKCKAMRITNLKLSAHLGFPLETLIGKKPKRKDLKFMFFNYCPWCGKKGAK